MIRALLHTAIFSYSYLILSFAHIRLIDQIFQIQIKSFCLQRSWSPYPKSSFTPITILSDLFSTITNSSSFFFSATSPLICWTTDHAFLYQASDGHALAKMAGKLNHDSQNFKSYFCPKTLSEHFESTFLVVFLIRKPLSTPVVVPCVAAEKVSDVRTQGPVVLAGRVQVYTGVHTTQQVSSTPESACYMCAYLVNIRRQK